MCQNPSKDHEAAPPTSKNKSQNDDDGIIIRAYNEDCDKKQVHALFVAGMMSLVPVGFRTTVTRAPQVYVPLTAWIGTVGYFARAFLLNQRSSIKTGSSLLLVTASAKTAAALPLAGIYM
jgi:hypothetical protein